MKSIELHHFYGFKKTMNAISIRFTAVNFRKITDTCDMNFQF